MTHHTDGQKMRDTKEPLMDMICRQSLKEMEIARQIAKGQARAAVDQLSHYIASVLEKETEA